MSKTAPIRQTSSAWQRLEGLFLLAGLLAVNVWVWSLVRTAAVQGRESRIFDDAMERSWERPSPLGGKIRGERTPEIAPDSLIGRLAIPRLHLESMVREGDGEGTLSVALGHVPGTALPGEIGNVAVAGHRDTLFRGLGKIRPKDKITFQTLQGVYEYQVESTQVVKPGDVDVLRTSGASELTLVTCYPFSYIGAAPDRFIVKARMVARLAAGLP